MVKNPEVVKTLDNYDSRKLEELKKEVINSNTGLDKLVSIYEGGGVNVVSKLLENILLDDNIKLNNKIEFLNKLKNKEKRLYYYSVMQVLLSLDTKKQLNTFLSRISKEDLKTALLYYPKLDKDFEKEFLKTYTSSDKDFYCGGKKSPDCNLVGSYIYTLMKKYNQKIDPDIAYKAIVDTFGNEPIKNFAKELREILNLRQELGKIYSDNLKDVFEKKGLIGVIKYFNNNMLDNLGFNDFGKGVVYFGEAVVGLFALFKVISYIFNKLGWKGILGGGLLGLLYVGNDKVHDMAQPVVDFFDKFFTGGFGDDDKKKAVEFGKQSKENAVLIAGPLFVSTLFSGKKVSDIKKYLKFDNEKISFDIEKYLKDLPNDSWMKALILQMGKKKAKILIEDGLSKLGISKDTPSDTKIDDLLNKYKNKIQSQTKKKKDISVPVGVSIKNKHTSNSQINTVPKKQNTQTVTDKISSQNFLDKNAYVPKTKLMYWKDGNYYIIGKDGKGYLVTSETLNLSPDIKEKLKEYKNFKEKVDLVVFMIQALGTKYPDTCGKDVKTALEKIQNALSEILTSPKKVDLSNYFNSKILSQLELVAGRGTMGYEIKEIFTKNYDNIEDLKLAVYEYIRNELGLSDIVANKIAEENFYQLKFTEKEIKKYYECLLKDNISCVVDDTEMKKFLNSVGKTSDDLKNDLEKLKEKLFKAKKDLNIQILAKKAHMNPEDYEQSLNKLLLEKGLKLLLFSYWVSSKVDNLGKIRDKDSVKNYEELNLYSDIKGYGIWNLSDANSEIFKQLVMLSAIEIISFGVGGLIAGAGAAGLEAFTAARVVAKGADIVEDITALSRTERLLNTLELGGQVYRVSKAGKIAYVVADTVIEGTLFYEGANLVQNIFEKRNLFEGAGDIEEIAKSILFIGALKGFAKLVEKIPSLKVKDTDKLSTKIFKLTGQVTLEGLGIGFISGGINVVFDKGDWRVEDFVEGIIMAMMFRLAGGAANKLLIRKGEDGRIELFKTDSKKKRIDFKNTNKLKELDLPESLKLTISDGKTVEVGYDNTSKKYYFKDENGNILEFGDYKSLKKYLEEKGLFDIIETKVKLEKLSDYIQSTEYKKKIAGSNIYIREIKGKDFEIKTSDGKTYVIGKEEVNGKEEFYVIPKEENKYKVNEKISVDEFLKKHPEIIKNYYEKIEKVFQQKLINSNQKLTKAQADKIAKILGEPAKLLYNKTVGDVYNSISSLLKQEYSYLKNKQIGSALWLPVKWLLTGKIEPMTFKDGTIQVLKNIGWLVSPYVIQGLVTSSNPLGLFLADTKDDPVNILIEYILRSRWKLLALGYDSYSMYSSFKKDSGSPSYSQSF